MLLLNNEKTHQTKWLNIHNFLPIYAKLSTRMTQHKQLTFIYMQTLT